MFRPSLFPDTGFDFAIGLNHRFPARKIQLYPANVGFVRDRFRIEFQHHGKTDGLRKVRRLRFVFCQARFHSRNSIKRENVLGFRLGQNGPARPRESFPGMISLVIAFRAEESRLPG